MVTPLLLSVAFAMSAVLRRTAQQIARGINLAISIALGILVFATGLTVGDIWLVNPQVVVPLSIAAGIAATMAPEVCAGSGSSFGTANAARVPWDDPRPTAWISRS
jgi:hypothetical protein